MVQKWFDAITTFGGYRSLNHFIAYLLALDVQAWREYQHDKTMRNYGLGFYYITNSSGQLINFGIVGDDHNHPQLGTRAYTGSPISDSEQILMRKMNDVVAPALLNCGYVQPGDTLHFVLYTQRTPCPSCRSAMIRGVQQLKTDLPGVTINFGVWKSTDQTLPYVFYPGTVSIPPDVVQVGL